jgi:hypothetical protein
MVVDFINLGYELFLDKEKLKATFLTADIFDDNSELNTKLIGHLDIIHASNFFHLWKRDRQVEAAKRMVKLLNPRPGSLLVGTHTGCRPGKTFDFEGRNMVLFLQSPESWKQMWDQVSRETGIRFAVEVIEGQYTEQALYQWPKDQDLYRLIYTIRRES